MQHASSISPLRSTPGEKFILFINCQLTGAAGRLRPSKDIPRLARTKLAVRSKPRGASSPISHCSQSGGVYKFMSRGQFLVTCGLTSIQARLTDLGHHKDVPQACINKISRQIETRGCFIAHPPIQHWIKFKFVGLIFPLVPWGRYLPSGHAKISCNGHCRLLLVSQDRFIASLRALCPPTSQISARKPISNVVQKPDL